MHDRNGKRVCLKHFTSFSFQSPVTLWVSVNAWSLWESLCVSLNGSQGCTTVHNSPQRSTSVHSSPQQSTREQSTTADSLSKDAETQKRSGCWQALHGGRVVAFHDKKNNRVAPRPCCRRNMKRYPSAHITSTFLSTWTVLECLLKAFDSLQELEGHNEQLGLCVSSWNVFLRHLILCKN